MKKIFQETIIIFVCGLAFCWISIQFFYLPLNNDIKNTKSILQQNKVRNNRIKNLAEKPGYFDDLNQKIAYIHDEINSFMPKQIKLSELLREFSALATKTGVSIKSIKPILMESKKTDVDVQVPGGFTKSIIRIILDSEYESIVRYIDMLENNNLTILTLKDLRIAFVGEERAASHLETILTIEAFYKGR